jgi:SAM-dependent methyltransferase
VFEKDWLVQTIASESVGSAAAKHAHGRLLDIGCGSKPYEKITRKYVSEHLGLDQPGSSRGGVKPDLESTAYDIPAPDCSFDTVLCTAAIEHLEEPGKALSEAFRVMKPGGCAIYTAPLYWHCHEQPRDFYRYTEFGLRYLFEEAGFQEVQIAPLSGFCVTFGQQLVYYLWMFRKGGAINPLWWIVPPLGFLIQRACYALNRVDRSPQFTWMYIVTAGKPEESEGEIAVVTEEVAAKPGCAGAGGRA